MSELHRQLRLRSAIADLQVLQGDLRWIRSSQPEERLAAEALRWHEGTLPSGSLICVTAGPDMLLTLQYDIKKMEEGETLNIGMLLCKRACELTPLL